MKINLDSPGEEVRIEIIPLIDVIFCILTFFILAAVGLTRQQAITVDLPKVGTGTAQMREMLIVSINTVGQIYVERELMLTRQQLRQQLLGYREQNPTGLLVLYASKQALYEDVVQVLDVMRDVGGDRVALATLPVAAEQSPDAVSPPPSNLGIPGLTPLPGNVPASPTPNSSTP